MALGKRILREKRALIIPVALGVIVNIAAYALWVYPLGVKSAGAANRAAVAAQSLQARRLPTQIGGARLVVRRLRRQLRIAARVTENARGIERAGGHHEHRDRDQPAVDNALVVERPGGEVRSDHAVTPS